MSPYCWCLFCVLFSPLLSKLTLLLLFLIRLYIYTYIPADGPWNVFGIGGLNVCITRYDNNTYASLSFLFIIIITIFLCERFRLVAGCSSPRKGSICGHIQHRDGREAVRSLKPKSAEVSPRNRAAYFFCQEGEACSCGEEKLLDSRGAILPLEFGEASGCDVRGPPSAPVRGRRHVWSGATLGAILQRGGRRGRRRRRRLANVARPLPPAARRSSTGVPVWSDSAPCYTAQAPVEPASAGRLRDRRDVSNRRFQMVRRDLLNRLFPPAWQRALGDVSLVVCPWGTRSRSGARDTESEI